MRRYTQILASAAVSLLALAHSANGAERVFEITGVVSSFDADATQAFDFTDPSFTARLTFDDALPPS